MRVREMTAASTPTLEEYGSLEEEGGEEFGDGTTININNIPTFSPNGKFTSFETRGKNDRDVQDLTLSSSGDEVTRPRKRDRKYEFMFWIMIIFDAIILAGFLGAYYGRKEHGDRDTFVSPQEFGDFQSVPEDANSVPAPSPIAQTSPKPTRNPHRKHDHKEKPQEQSALEDASTGTTASSSSPIALIVPKPTRNPHRKHDHKENPQEQSALEDASTMTTAPSYSPVALSTPKPTRSPHKKHNHVQNHHDHGDEEPEQSGVISNSTSAFDDKVADVTSSNTTEPKQSDESGRIDHLGEFT